MPTLEETIALLEATLEATHDAILVVDVNRRVAGFNRQFLQMFGLRADQLVGQDTRDVFAVIRDQLENADDDAENAGEFSSERVPEALPLMRFKDGRIYHRSISPQVVNGRVVGRVASYRDISEWHRTQLALEQSRAFLEKAQEVAHIGSWAAELDGSGALGWSAETCRIFGMTRANFPGTSEAFLALVHPDDRDSLATATATALEGGRPYELEHRIVRADGEVRWVRERADIVRNETGKPLRLVGTVQDITERRRLEEQLHQSQKLEAIGRLAGGVAHDLNNALTAIVGYTELALTALNDAPQARADVTEIRRAAERAESVTRQLLAFSRKQLLEPRIFHVHQSIAALGRMLERLLGADIRLKTNAPSDLPPIYGDPGQIEQAVINLAVNARDAMPQGGSLTLAARLTRIDDAFARAHLPMPQGEYVEVEVTDTGEGMPPDIQAHIFEPFFTTKGVGKGTGLGLAMVYGTVKQSGGFIFVESEVGKGTTFRLYFPPVREDRKQAAPTPRADGVAATILVAEDEPAVRSLVVSALKGDGYHVLQASGGTEALHLAANAGGPIHLLLTDASMPGMNGVELARRLAQERPDLKVVIMSGYTTEALEIEGLNTPPATLPKPFTPRDLRAKVRQTLGT